jgi:hypothetical protein
METADLLEWATTTKFESPVTLKCGFIHDVEYFAKVQVLRIEYGAPKEQSASIERLMDLYRTLNGS